MASSMSSTPGSAMSSNNSNAGSNKPPRILACVLCQHRKIRCDRTFPCANCTKANVRCTPSTPAPARKRRRPNQDLQERLARCEELLKEYATEKPESPVSTPRPVQTPVYDDPQMNWQPAGKLVKEDGGVRFMDSFLLGTVYDELKAMREIVDADDDDDGSPDSMTPDGNSDLIIGADTPEQSPESLWPEPGQLFRLWQIYLDRVNPLTKIIHVPTLQPYLAEAINGPQNIPKGVEALLFSVFTMAVVALSAGESQALFGYSRDEALARFSNGVRLSLMRSSFLKSHDLTTLQALVIYVISLQGRYNRHAAWILNGVVLRIAQKMGLHRDGEVLGLSPFESEMRRRLWWQIIMVDAKFAMFCGLSHQPLLPRSWDTKPPRNVNDADIHPSATEPFQDREGPTEMIFCLMQYKFAEFLVHTPGLEAMIMATHIDGAAGAGGPSDEQMMKFRHTAEALGKELIDLLSRHCDPAAGPVHELAIEMRKHVVQKVTELITYPKIQPSWGGEQKSMQSNAFKVAVGTLEHDESNYMAQKDKGFIWHSLVHFRIEIFMYLAGQLCHRTEGPLVDRAWHQVGVVYTFHPHLLDVSSKTNYTLAIFILKAWRKREEILISRTGRVPETPFYVDKLRAVMPSDEFSPEGSPPIPFNTPSMMAPNRRQPGESDPIVDQLLGGYLDVSALDWDMFGSMPMNMAGGPVMNNMGDFGLGQQPEW
ncbi:fungal-specific transcription factor domain-containing protein [Podospora appendiculata]|uniref:Fungal-specific transcription factor domain-containing protein n=1 Tax=Podospora appendiculata TaxID=314037 RepID=A0AAE0X525_9PEZI|nr:fungal-specific transcription factor domain-containing protein [Podospora appendiculata]